MKQDKNVKQETIEWKSFGVLLRVSLPEDVKAEFLDRYDKFLPSIREDTDLDSSSQVKEMIQVNFVRGESSSINLVENSAYVITNASTYAIATDAIALISSLLERSLNKKGIFSLHSGGFAYDGSGVLLIGPNGSGKTTTAVYSCMTHSELGYITGNRAFVVPDSREILGGVEKFSIRNNAMLDELRPFVSESLQKGRTHFYSKQVGINRSNFPVKIKVIMLLMERDIPLSVYSPEENSENELFSLCDAIEVFGGRRQVMFGSRLPYPNIFDIKLRGEKVKAIEKLCNDIPFLYVDGRLKEVATFAIDYLKNQ